MFVLCNAFSINMLTRANGARDLTFVPVAREAARNLVINHSARGEFQCAIGHADTARVVASDLGLPERATEWAAIAETRPNVVFDGNSLVVAQYRGPRLPAAATELPEGAVIEYWQVYPALR